jgi:hypothetical protein
MGELPEVAALVVVECPVGETGLERLVKEIMAALVVVAAKASLVPAVAVAVRGLRAGTGVVVALVRVEVGLPAASQGRL